MTRHRWGSLAVGFAISCSGATFESAFIEPIYDVREDSVEAALDGDDGASIESGDAVDGAVDAVEVVRRVFVTSTVHVGALGGLAGADAICQARADAAKIGGTYRAWLSTVVIAARARLDHHPGRYALVDGTIVADGWIELTSGALRHAIDRTESGGQPPIGTMGCVTGAPAVRTNTTPAGASGAFDCAGFTKTTNPPDGEAPYGNPSATGVGWTAACLDRACDKTAALYCVEQSG
jgi:hypothetical protein